MRRDDAIRLLKEHEAEFRALGVRALSLFGSTVRNEATSASDVDLLVDFEEDRRITLFGLSEIKFLAADVLGATADIALQRDLRPAYRAGIEAEAEKVF
jgi:predicted nucleotidyltransferase